MNLSRSSKYIALLLVLLGMANLTSAAIIPPDAPPFQITMQVGGGPAYPIVPTSVAAVQAGDHWKYQVDGTYNQHGYEMTLSFLVDPDPSVTGNVTLKNTLPTTQDFTFNFVTPVAPALSASLLNGSIGLTTTADDTAAVVASTSPDAIYTALIDGTSVHTLMNHPFALPAAAFDSAVATDRFGIPVPIAGGAVATNIGIKLHFSVTPGDQASITSQFTANPVPEPASLLGLALGGLILVRRRK